MIVDMAILADARFIETDVRGSGIHYAARADFPCSHLIAIGMHVSNSVAKIKRGEPRSAPLISTFR
jgi:hypothetical protein